MTFSIAPWPIWPDIFTWNCTARGMDTLPIVLISLKKKDTPGACLLAARNEKKTRQKMLEVVLRGLEVVLRGLEVVLSSEGAQVISPARGLALHLHDHHFQHSALLFFCAF